MASSNGALDPSSQAQLNGIQHQDEAKGAVVHSFNPDASPQEKAAAAGKARDQLQSVSKDESAGGKGNASSLIPHF